MKKIATQYDFELLYSNYSNDTLHTLVKALAEEIAKNKEKKGLSEVDRITKYYENINKDTKASKLFRKALTDAVIKLRAEYKKIRDTEIDEIVTDLLNAEDRDVTILLSESDYLSNRLNDYIESNTIDLTKERVLLIAPTGIGKSTATGGLKLKENQSILILKDNKPLVENAYEDLQVEMAKGTIETRKLFRLHGEEKLTSSELKNILRTPNAILITTYNQILRITDAISDIEESYAFDNKLLLKKGEQMFGKIDWILIIDEIHRLVTDSYRSKPMEELAAILNLDGNKGYLTMTATPKTYCPLEYDRIINVRRDGNNCNGIVKMHNGDTDLEKLLKEELKIKSDMKKIVIYFQNSEKALNRIHKELTETGVKAAVMTSEIFTKEKDIEGTLAYEVRNGRLGGLDCILSTVLLTEGVSFTEEYDEVVFFLNLTKGTQAEDITTALQITQAAKRVRKVKTPPIIHITRKDIPIGNDRYEDLKKFTIGRLVASPDRRNDRQLLNILDTQELVNNGEITIKEAEDVYYRLKAALVGDGFILDRRLYVKTDMVYEPKRIFTLVDTVIKRTFTNYNLDVILEGGVFRLFETRLTRNGFVIEKIEDLHSIDKEESDRRKDIENKAEENAKSEVLKKLKQHYDLKEYIVEELFDKKSGGKLETTLGGLAYFFLEMGKSKEEVFELLESHNVKALKTIKKTHIRNVVYGIELTGSKYRADIKDTYLAGDEIGLKRLNQVRELEIKLNEYGESIVGKLGMKLDILINENILGEGTRPLAFFQELFDIDVRVNQHRSGINKDIWQHKIKGINKNIENSILENEPRYKKILKTLGILEQIEKEID